MYFLITLQSGTGTTTDQVQGNFFFSDYNFETLNDMNLLILFYPCMSQVVHVVTVPRTEWHSYGLLRLHNKFFDLVLLWL